MLICCFISKHLCTPDRPQPRAMLTLSSSLISPVLLCSPKLVGSRRSLPAVPHLLRLARYASVWLVSAAATATVAATAAGAAPAAGGSRHAAPAPSTAIAAAAPDRAPGRRPPEASCASACRSRGSCSALNDIPNLDPAARPCVNMSTAGCHILPLGQVGHTLDKQIPCGSHSLLAQHEHINCWG